jgi:hypothetical protein
MSSKDLLIDIKSIIANTNILTIVSQILSMNDNQNLLIRYMKLEATWIMSNIGYGDEQDILAMFDSQYGIQAHVNRIL